MLTAFPGDECGEVVWLEWLDWEWEEWRGDVVGGPLGRIVKEVGPVLPAPPPKFVPGILTWTCSFGWTSIL